MSWYFFLLGIGFALAFIILISYGTGWPARFLARVFRHSMMSSIEENQEEIRNLKTKKREFEKRMKEVIEDAKK